MNCLNGNLAKSFGSTTENEEAQNTVFEFYGRSMAGFELGRVPGEEKDVSKLPKFLRKRKYYDLKGQIDFLEEQLQECVEQMTRQANGRRPKVILIGHSVGSYILLELIQRHRKRLESFSMTEEVHKESEPGLRKRKTYRHTTQQREPDIVGGICLFPTVVNISHSKKGRALTQLSRIPHFPSILSGVSRVLTVVAPKPVLQFLVTLVTGLHGHNSEVTTEFIRSPRGVKQALHMGCDEMQSIKVDKWDAEIWGAAHSSPSQVPRPRLFFYFGEDDHWVADRTRDDLIALRGRADEYDHWKPWMEIDTMKIPHGFCISK
jgi:pimeloyl-ACP methyl ester carboxylesterase